jgi:class 3 adenylate cyclase
LALWLILVLALGSCLGLLCHLGTRYVKESVDHELQQLAQIAARFVDGDAQQRLQHNEDTDSPEYLRQIEPLLRFHLGAKQLRYVYTIRLEGNTIRFLLDTANQLRSMQPQAHLFHSSVMERYKLPNHAHCEALRAKKTTVSDIFSDEYGTFKSACAPVFDHAGNLAAAACVDMDARDYQWRIDGIRAIGVLGFVLMLGMITLLSWFIFHRCLRLSRQMTDRWQRQDNQQAELEAKNRSNETLLAQMLPGDIIRRIKAGETHITDAHAQASVMLVDIRHQTDAAIPLPTREMLAFLGQSFIRFGQLAAAQGLLKIRTQGDRCLIVGGLDPFDDQHAQRMARLALKIREAFTQLRQQHDLADASLRIGIATGPVIAGLIDTAPLTYDLWGETVNTASRLEIFSDPDKIQCDKAFIQAAGPGFEFFDRGEIHIRDKGFMHTYWLLGEVATPVGEARD